MLMEAEIPFVGTAATTTNSFIVGFWIFRRLTGDIGNKNCA
jgi:hypothetical protein